MGLLSPTVHDLLVTLLTFEEEDIDDFWVGDVAVAFDFFADCAPDCVGVDVETEGGYDFWGLMGVCVWG